MECLTRIAGDHINVHHDGDKYLIVYINVKLRPIDLEQIYKEDGLICFNYTTAHELFGGRFEYSFTKP